MEDTSRGQQPIAIHGTSTQKGQPPESCRTGFMPAQAIAMKPVSPAGQRSSPLSLNVAASHVPEFQAAALVAAHYVGNQACSAGMPERLECRSR